MGFITFTDAHTEVKNILGAREGIDTRINRWLNWALSRLAYRQGIAHHELNVIMTANTSDGTRRYALPVNTHSVLGVRNSTSKIKLQWRHWRELDWRDPSVKGVPTQYSRFGNNLEIEPTPDGVYQLELRLKKNLDQLSGTLTTPLHEQWDEAWVELAAAIGYEKLLEPDRAAYHFALAEALIESYRIPEFEETEDASYTGMTLSPRRE